MKVKEADIRKIYAVIILAVSLLCIIIRAHYTAITLDEAHTYISYVEEIRPGYMEGFFEDYDGRANNHLLNTALMYLVNYITDIHYDEFLIRLPNVIFGGIFGFLCFYMYVRKMLTTLEFSLLMLNPELNGVFAVARGYGIALCLVMIAVFYLKRYPDSGYEEYSCLSLALLFFTLAESANTVVLLTTASAALLLLFVMIKKKALFPYLKRNGIYLTVMAVLNLLLLAYHFFVSADGPDKKLAAYEGNPFEGIIQGFVGEYTGRFAAAGMWLMVILMLTAMVLSILRKKELFFTPLFVIWFLLSSVMSIAGKGLPSGLRLLPACPIIILALSESLTFVWSSVWNRVSPGWSRALWSGFTAVCICCFAGHFVKGVHFVLDVNNLRTHLYDSAMGSYEGSLETEEFRGLHLPFYQKQFLYRYGYDIILKKYTLESMSIPETLRMLQNEKFDAMIDISNREILSKYSYELKKLGIDVRNLPPTTDFILINHGEGESLEYLYDFKSSDNTQDTILGEMSLHYGENESYGVYMNGYECLTVHPDQMQPDLSICVWQNEREEPMDYKCYVDE